MVSAPFDNEQYRNQGNKAIGKPNCYQKVIICPSELRRLIFAYRDIAEAIGLEAFTRLTLLCGGQNLYIPKRESLERNARDRDIRARFNGGNCRALAIQFNLSERQIRKIINGTRT